MIFELTAIVFALAFFGSADSQKIYGLAEGQICSNQDGIKSICKAAKECMHVDYKKDRPPICGFAGVHPIVCCPPKKERIANKKCKQYTAAECPQVSRPSVKRYIVGSLTNLLLGSGYKTTTERSDKETTVNNTKWTTVDEPPTTTKPVTLPQKKILGGRMSKSRENPNMALIGFGQKKGDIQWKCGGSLISHQHVLSAAHCTTTALGKPKWARFGELDLSTNKDETETQDRMIIDWIIHPDYNPDTVFNDIAIFKLDRKVDFTQYVLPTCLHTEPEIPAKKGIVTGFGTVEFAGMFSNTLQEVSISLVDGEECRQLFGEVRSQSTSRRIDPRSQICAGEKEGGKDACTGDSGGPLMIELQEECLKRQIGITSFGRSCGLPNMPGIYTRIFYYLDWIEKTVWPDE